MHLLSVATATAAACASLAAARRTACQTCTVLDATFKVVYGADGTVNECADSCGPQNTVLKDMVQCVSDVDKCGDLLPVIAQSNGKVHYPADSCFAQTDCESCTADPICEMLRDMQGNVRCVTKNLMQVDGTTVSRVACQQQTTAQPPYTDKTATDATTPVTVMPTAPSTTLPDSTEDVTSTSETGPTAGPTAGPTDAPPSPVIMIASYVIA